MTKFTVFLNLVNHVNIIVDVDLFIKIMGGSPGDVSEEPVT